MAERWRFRKGSPNYKKQLNMIPKIIHYTWFGRGEKSDLIKKCIASWKKFCPEYQIIEWNEDNFDVNAHVYSKFAYEHKYWAFVSDYARLKIIYENGGIYLDTDVELIRNIDFLLENKYYCGCEQPNKVNTGVGFGAEKNSIISQKMLAEYDDVKFVQENGELNLTNCPYYNTNALIKMGVVPNNTLQKTAYCTIYPIEYFSSKSYETGIINSTINTVSIHHFSGSWEDIESLNKKYKQHRIGNLFGHKMGSKIIFIVDLIAVSRKKGLVGSIRGIINQFTILVQSKATKTQ